MALKSRLLPLVLATIVPCGVGCGSGIAIAPPSKLATGAATTIYVTQLANSTAVGPGSILEFSASASGTAQPLRIVTPPPALIALQGMTVDSVSGDIYVGGFTTTLTNKISQVYQLASGANGLAVPTKSLLVSGGNPGEMIVDSAGNLYVGSDAEIDVFSPSGGAQPVRVISGSSTQLSEVNGIAVDKQGNIFVTNGFSGIGSVLVFASTANGNVPPLRTITGVGTANFYGPSGIALDTTGNLYVASYLSQTPSPAQPASIFELASGTSGFGTPLSTITGSSTGLAGVGSMQFDGADNLYVLVISPGGQPSISVFSQGSNGNVPPVRTFSSTAWTDTGYGQIGLY